MNLKKTIIVLFWTVLLFPDGMTAQGFVHLENGKLMDGSSDTISLNAINIGGWLLWEGWIWGGGFHSEKRIMRNVTKVIDREYAAHFQKTIYKNYVTKKDIIAIKKAGFNSIRIPINHAVLDGGVPGGMIYEERFYWLDQILQWCQEEQIYAILDLHALPGGQNKVFISDPDEVDLWKSPVHRRQTIRIWSAIAQRYQNNTIVAGYDLINEPSVKDCSQLLGLYTGIIGAIREVDKNHLLIVEGNKFAHSFKCFDSLLDTNQIFSFHFYPWFRGNKGKQRKLKSHSDFAKKVGAPVWCGEWGEDSIDDLTTIGTLLVSEVYDFCGTAFWTWKKAVTSSHPAVNEITVTKNMKRLLKGKSPRKSDSAQKELDLFLKNVDIDLTKRDERLITLFNTMFLNN